MPRAKQEADVEETVEETNGKRPYVPRLSISVTSEMQKNIRIASAIADMRVGDWCTTVLEKAAEKVISEG